MRRETDDRKLGLTEKEKKRKKLFSFSSFSNVGRVAWEKIMHRSSKTKGGNALTSETYDVMPR